MKKKITAIALVVALLAIALIGGTMAYFTDTKSVDNTFTAGGVKIVLNEQQRKVVNGEKTTDLEDFKQNQTLMPIVTTNGSVQEDGKDELRMSKSKNYVDKMITVTNTGSSEAYVRVYMAVPKALEDKESANGTFTNSILHVNYFWKTNGDAADKTFSEYWNMEVFVGTKELSGTTYNVYYRQYATPLAANTTTNGRAYDGMYLDQGVDMNENGKYTMDGVEFDFNLKTVKIPVAAVAVQTTGFENDADAAFTAAFGANYIPFQ